MKPRRREDNVTWWQRVCKASLKRHPLTASELANGQVDFEARRLEEEQDA